MWQPREVQWKKTESIKREIKLLRARIPSKLRQVASGWKTEKKDLTNADFLGEKQLGKLAEEEDEKEGISDRTEGKQTNLREKTSMSPWLWQQ